MRHFVRLLHASVLSVSVASIACTSRDAPAKSAAKLATDHGAALQSDSCARLDAKAYAQNTADSAPLPKPRVGSWMETRTVKLDGFTLEIPRVARVHPQGESQWVDSLPGCRFFCSLEVTLARDSTTASLESYIAARRTVDTTSNPDAEDWVPGPPHYVSFGGRRAAIMEIPCGDCTSGEVLFSRAGQIARLEYSIDDREGFQPGIACRLQRMASTLRWTGPKPQ